MRSGLVSDRKSVEQGKEGFVGITLGSGEVEGWIGERHPVSSGMEEG